MYDFIFIKIKLNIKVTFINNKLNIRVNSAIRAQSVRVLDDSGDMIGVMQVREAISIANTKGLDLVEISPNAQPPVCKIVDFGKYRYEQQKKLQEAKKKQKVVELKEIKVRPNIADGDYKVKMRNIKTFIEAGNKVKVALIFRGREIAHNEVGFAIMNKMRDEVAAFANIDLKPTLEGKQILMMLSPM